MKTLICATLALVAISISVSVAMATTATGTIGETALVDPGNSVSAYLIGEQIITTVRDEETPHLSTLYGVSPIVQINFQMEPSWHLVKHVTWDKAHRKLTISF
jgi:hypothetical protein